MLKPHCPNAFRQRGRKGEEGVVIIHHQGKEAAECNAVHPSICSPSPLPLTHFWILLYILEIIYFIVLQLVYLYSFSS